MKIYEQHSDDIEASGAVFLGYIESMGPFKPMAEKTLSKNGIEQVELEAWYPRQIILDILKQMDKNGGSTAVFQMGKKMAKNTQIPDGIDSYEQMVLATPEVYPVYNRNCPADKDFIKAKKIGPNKIKYTYHTPYPTSAIKGFLTYLLRKMDKGKELKMELTKGAQDDYAREFILSW